MPLSATAIRILPFDLLRAVPLTPFVANPARKVFLPRALESLVSTDDFVSTEGLDSLAALDSLVLGDYSTGWEQESAGQNVGSLKSGVGVGDEAEGEAARRLPEATC
ncbi:hypothetical protein GCM10022223_64720 [Kineosporia mesophila]|uniref:Uncharacterized protein n=1 Tax=Kineosporia mesophila TaxID=566012 RepID=A0ABP7AP43_9ACTN